MSCRGKQRTGGDQRQTKVVWMSEKKRESSSAAQRGKGAAKQRIVRRTGKHSQRGSKRKRRQENVQLKRSMIGHRNRKSRYTQRYNSKGALG